MPLWAPSRSPGASPAAARATPRARSPSRGNYRRQQLSRWGIRPAAPPMGGTNFATAHVSTSMPGHPGVVNSESSTRPHQRRCRSGSTVVDAQHQWRKRLHDEYHHGAGPQLINLIQAASSTCFPTALPPARQNHQVSATLNCWCAAGTADCRPADERRHSFRTTNHISTIASNERARRKHRHHRAETRPQRHGSHPAWAECGSLTNAGGSPGAGALISGTSGDARGLPWHRLGFRPKPALALTFRHECESVYHPASNIEDIQGLPHFDNTRPTPGPLPPASGVGRTSPHRNSS